ncbi:Copia protein [Durusdinium trenchii]|uniref:Copia protein n=1 Tax=Durusdinium trenchii TaxID=1381693 RepID=A0ABP0RVB6_9DINO
MSHFEVPFESTSEAPHEHLVTEHAILAATSAGAQAMKIAQKPTPSKASGSTSSTERHVPETSMARPSQAPETIGAKAKASPGVTAQELQEVLTTQDHKFQGMLNQVLQSISTLHQASHLPGPMTSGPMETEATMDFGWTQDEIQQMNRDYYQDDLEWRQANGIPPRDHAKEVNEVYEEQWHRAMDHFQNEIFVTTLTVGDEKSFQSHAMSENRLISKNPDLVENDRFPKTFVTEVYTNTERVAQTARKRGHRVGASMSLESGWNFLRPLDRKAARAVLKRESPFFLVLAFPCSFWSVLLNLNPPKNGAKMYEEAITLLQFALQLAKDQKSRGCHFVLENPQSSRAWTLEEMQRALEQLEARCVVFHQCRFRLKNQAGDLLRKATRIATSSDEILSQLDGMKCLGNHPHGHIIGGKAVSEPAGHYPWALAKALVVGMEKQFEADFKRPHNTLAIEGGEEAEDETALPIDMNLSDSDQESTEAVTGPKVHLHFLKLYELPLNRDGRAFPVPPQVLAASHKLPRGLLNWMLSACVKKLFNQTLLLQLRLNLQMKFLMKLPKP